MPPNKKQLQSFEIDIANLYFDALIEHWKTSL